VTRKATIAALRADLDATQRDMWTVAIENVAVAQECKRLQAIVDRQDATIMALWSMVEAAEKKQAKSGPSDCAHYDGCVYRHYACTPSYAAACGAYVGKGAT
jgi:hypothetical protein